MANSNNSNATIVNIFTYMTKTVNDAYINESLLKMQEVVGLTPEDIDNMKNIALNREVLLKDEDRSILSDRSPEQYNEMVEDLSTETIDSFKTIIGLQKLNKLKEFLLKWISLEASYRKNWLNERRESLRRGGIDIVYATQCYCPDALPCLSLKFANLKQFGWIPEECQNIYKPPGPFTIDIYNEATGIKLQNIVIKETGPMFNNDDYWNCTCRKYKDLACMTPAAEACFYENYNNGKDEFGRIVRSPAAIDLNVETAKKLGIGFLDNVWLMVDFSRLPMCPRLRADKNVEMILTVRDIEANTVVTFKIPEQNKLVMLDSNKKDILEIEINDKDQVKLNLIDTKKVRNPDDAMKCMMECVKDCYGDLLCVAECAALCSTIILGKPVKKTL